MNLVECVASELSECSLAVSWRRDVYRSVLKAVARTPEPVCCVLRRCDGSGWTRSVATGTVFGLSCSKVPEWIPSI